MRNSTGAALAAHRQEHAGPVLGAFADWLAGQTPRVLPKSAIGEAVTYAANQWPSLVEYVRDCRLTIDNGPAEQAIRPLTVGRNNWLHIGGDGGLRPTAVLVSIAASVRRHGVKPWGYFKHVRMELPTRPAGADLTDLLPDQWAGCRARQQIAFPTSCTKNTRARTTPRPRFAIAPPSLNGASRSDRPCP